MARRRACLHTLSQIPSGFRHQRNQSSMSLRTLAYLLSPHQEAQAPLLNPNSHRERSSLQLRHRFLAVAPRQMVDRPGLEVGYSVALLEAVAAGYPATVRLAVLHSTQLVACSVALSPVAYRLVIASQIPRRQGPSDHHLLRARASRLWLAPRPAYSTLPKQRGH
jgi:hypothetical protein